jgi:hypothetical protein
MANGGDAASAVSAVVDVDASAPAPPARPVFARSAGDHWTVEASAPGDCQVGADCAATLRVRATGAYHVNREFPHKFIADATGVAFPAGSRFTAFSYESDTAGVLPVRFQGTAAGTATLSGSLRTCVCIGATACEPVTVPVSLAVPMRP